MRNAHIERDNEHMLRLLSRFLCDSLALISGDDVSALARDCGVSREYAYALLLAAACGLDVGDNAQDRALFEEYFSRMVHELDADEYARDPYYANVEVPLVREGKWELLKKTYAPYEAFVCGDMTVRENGRLLPSIGFFDREFSYPAVTENGREWMLITPNEIETMRGAIMRAHGNVLTYGLGLGYFAYMAGMKPSVRSVTVVERDAEVIALFNKHILPKLACADKLRIIEGDALLYAARRSADGMDFVFADIWHDPSDGIEPYLALKKLEAREQRSEYAYWIEPTLKCYIADGEASDAKENE